MKIFCFSPNDAVWRWTLPQAQFLESLKQRGDIIEYLFCDRTFASFCMSMASLGVGFDAPAEDKAAICERCISNSRNIRNRFGFEGHPIHGYLADTERALARDLSQKMTVAEMIAYKYCDIAVGKFALYEVIIQTKSISLELSEAAERLYRLTFENCIFSAFATRRALDEHKPDVAITYHAAYSYNRVFQNLAEARGIPVWFLNASFNMSELDTHLVAARSDPEVLFRKMLADWDRFRVVPSQPKALTAAANHLIRLMEGGGLAYSTAMRRRGKSALSQLGCSPRKKVLLALLSSYDELLAAELSGYSWTAKNAVFSNQLDWIHWLYEFSSNRDDVHIIIRVHPREFPINGVGQRSEHSLLLEKIFAQHPENVSINLPSDHISVYELLIEADVALIAWSSVGMEAGMLGIPVVTCFGDALMFPRTLTFEAHSRGEYAGTIERALSSGWSIERARLFFRWAVLSLVRTRIDMTNGRAPSVRSGRTTRFVRRGLNALRRRLTPWTDQIWTIERRARRLDAAAKIYSLVDRQQTAFYDHEATEPVGNEHQELTALKAQLRTIAKLIRRNTGVRAGRLEMMLTDNR